MRTQVKNKFLILLLGSLFIIHFMGCQDLQNTAKQDWETVYQSKVQQSLANEKKHNEIFLGFRLRGSEKEYKEKLQQLVDAGKIQARISLENSNKFFSEEADTIGYFYNLKLPTSNHPVKIVPVFEENQLVQLELILAIPPPKDNLQLQYKETVALYQKKYGNGFLERKHIYSSNDFYWIVDNLEIKLFSDISAIHIQYTDLNWNVTSNKQNNSFNGEIESDQTTVLEDI